MSKLGHQFGGPWTEDKLDRITRYLQAYTTALKNQPFRLMYVDAFAGTGYRASKRPGETVRGFFPLPQATGLARGSVRRALEVEPPFDEYVFIEANLGRFHELHKVEEEYPGRRARMRFRNEEANSAIVHLCRATDWRQTRAVMFLDPYGMQVDWRTIEEVARAQHIDLWYLFPIGTVQRLLPRQGGTTPAWASALDRILGEGDWRKAFYEVGRQPTLFGDVDREIKVANLGVIEAYVRGRLAGIFRGGVADNALQLRNSMESCMFLLFFACGNPNPRAHSLALRIAGHVLKSR
jgi:three-Cys-motif partner protein